MPSIIQADQLKSADGNTTYLNSGTLSNLIFPTGNIQQIQTVTCTAVQYFSTNSLTAVSGFNKSITVGKTGSKILVQLCLTAFGTSNSSTSNRCYAKITESATSLDYWLTDADAWTNSTSDINYRTTTLYYLHTHGQNAGTTLTYTPKFGNGSNSTNGVRFNYYYDIATGGDARQSYMVLTELA